MYARACRSWYGTKAKSVVRAKIHALKAKGDDKGAEAWERVARALIRSKWVPINLIQKKPEMTSRQRCELVSHFLKTRHGIEACRRRIAKLISGNPMLGQLLSSIGVRKLQGGFPPTANCDVCTNGI